MIWVYCGRTLVCDAADIAGYVSGGLVVGMRDIQLGVVAGVEEFGALIYISIDLVYTIQ